MIVLLFMPNTSLLLARQRAQANRRRRVLLLK